MTTPISPLKLSDVQTEFGGSNPISLSEYYKGGGHVPSSVVSGGYGTPPTTGTFAMGTLRNLQNVTVDSSGYGIYSQGAVGGTSSGTINLTGSGTVTHSGSGSVTAGQYGGPAAWVTPATSGNAALFDIIVDSITTVVGGGSATGPSVGSWTSMSGGVSFSMSNSGNAAPEKTWNCRIRNHSSGQIVATFTVDISLENT